MQGAHPFTGQHGCAGQVQCRPVHTAGGGAGRQPPKAMGMHGGNRVENGPHISRGQTPGKTELVGEWEGRQERLVGWNPWDLNDSQP